ncbi:murein hydrolase activator NlpD [Glaesserella parasuis]|uniref:murein hydrolase activator NlpD n=1 Tax=Glaesserella parasuis TaxID=738 RepID=UPI00243647D1|nr:murein hydrolase activator NlpD [Glaesserella parasuis]MDG6241508.1 murein hydrolase activator NlpD [Glaesserella parasuis]MDO9871537.1 murein hydrolase activator NlpD [Glaesserella parasuis]MDP0065635.1 murein hydrolase activator NlpD [Glaesserella parasuis]MDP0073659.1 murein hydrolase activator NlpD [Glaesserella parasuis]MDP0078231.1 murein hydrolase activator NlpD [Glaesserella parasuis]
MKKSFFLLPLAALVLTACGSNTPAPVVNAEGSDLSPGVMQPIGMGANNTNYGWQTDVQSTSMPSTMTQPTYTPPPVPQPVYQAPQPTYQAPQPVPQVVPQPITKPTAKTTLVAKKPVSQDFTIPRDANNAPIYSQIDKGFYNGDSYTVRKGDTMFLIAYIAGKDVKEVAALNNMSEPYQLRVGQVLKLGNTQPVEPKQQTVQSPKPVPTPVEPVVTYTQAPNGTAYGSDGTMTGPVKASVGTVPPAQTSTTPRVTATAANNTPNYSSTSAPAVASSIRWQWPTQGRVISGFSASEGGNKGLDIAGTKGQPVKAAAAGRVVYAGNALQGYGNLIIIKHNDDFLSAYAHNDSIKVEEQDNVKAGETIATLGSTGTNSNKLHFEIRYQGKSVDPARYLPRQ